MAIVKGKHPNFMKILQNHVRLLQTVFIVAFSTNLLPAQSGDETALDKVPESVWAQFLQQPKNLMDSRIGTQLFEVSGQGTWQPLPGIQSGSNGENPNFGSKPAQTLPLGEQNLLITLPDFYHVNRMAMKPDGLAGTLQVFTANAALPANSQQWQAAGPPVNITPGEPLQLDFPIQETGFLLMRMNVTQAGSLGSMSLTGDEPIGAFRPAIPPVSDWPPPSDVTNTIPFDFATLTAGARITHVGSGNSNEAAHLIDEDTETAYDFPAASGDAIFLVQLADDFPINSAAITMAASTGRIELYAYRILPDAIAREEGEAGETGRLKLTAAFFETQIPVAFAEIEDPTDFVRIPFAEQRAKYILVRCIMNTPLEDFSVFQFSVIGPLPEIYERYFFNPVTLEVEFAEQAPPALEMINPTPDPPRLPPASL